MPDVLVFGKPNCPACKLTTARFDALGVPYTYRDLTEHPADLDMVRLLGYQMAPVVIVGDVHWGGFRADQINWLAAVYQSSPDLSGLEDAAVEYLREEAA